MAELESPEAPEAPEAPESTQQPAGLSTPRRRRRWPRWILAGLLVLTGGAVGGLTWLLHGQSGAPWLVSLAQGLLPGTLQVEQVEGRLTGPLAVRGLKYQDGPLEFALNSLDFDWWPSALLQGRLVVERLEVQGVAVKLPASEPAPPPSQPAQPFAGLDLPLDIQIDRVAVKDVRFTQGSAEPILIERLELATRTQGRRMEVTRLEAEAMGAGAEIKGVVELAPALPMDLDLNWRYQLPDGPGISGQGSLKGDLARLAVQQNLAPPLEARLQSTLTNLEAQLGWELDLALTQVALAELAPGLPANLSGGLKGSGDLTQGNLEGSLALEHREFGRLVADLGAGFDANSLTARQLKLTLPGGGLIQGKAGLTLEDQAFTADLDWKNLRWPLKGEPLQAASPKGQFQVRGHTSNYQFELTSGVKVPKAPDLNIKADGHGDLTQVILKQLQVALPKGHLDASGEVAWAPQVRWQLKLNGEGLDPSIALPDLPGKLALKLDTQGQLAPAGVQAAVNLERLEGRLRDYPLKGSGRVKVAGNRIDLDQVSLVSGSSKLEAHGLVSEQSDLHWDLKADNLASLWPGLAGRLQGSGRLQGKLAAPRLEAKLQGSGLGYQEHKIGQLQADAEVALDQNGKLDVNLTAKDLSSAGKHWSRLALTSEGRRGAHQIKLALEGKDVPTARLGLDGGLEADGDWTGRVTELELAEPQVGRWRMDKAAQLTLGVNQLLVDSLCLTGQGRVCLSAKGNPAANWQASLQVQGLSDAQVKQFLPPNLKLTAKAGLEANFKGEAGGRISGSAVAEIPEGRLQFETGGKAQNLTFSGARLKAELAPKGGNLELAIPLAPIGEVQGNLSLPGMSLASLDPKRQRLQGRVRARVGDLGFLAGMVPAISQPKGRVEADFQLSGSLAAPGVSGKLELLDAALDVPEVGLKLREMLARIQADNLDRVRYEASVRSGEGTLKLDGETRLQAKQGFPTEVRIKGNNWTAADIPEARLLISPDLTFSHRSQGMELTGTLKVPSAKLKPRQLPQTAKSASSDLVVMKKGKPAPDQAKGPNLKARLRLILGDEVELDGFGLKGFLAGNLEVIDQPGRPVLGTGSLSIRDGTYRAYGQDLTIERGRVQFSESPVDNPGLDLRAVRKVDDITAGLRVSGSLRKPEMTLFSTPTMAQNAVLSYLLTGQAPSGSGAMGLAASAALSHVSGGGESFTDKIARWVGLDELRMETSGNMSGASMTTGSWLSPRLYVQYVNDLTNPDPKLRIRYSLTKKLQIQAESGRAQGLDVLYTMER